MTDDDSEVSQAVDRYLRSSGDSDQYRQTAETVLDQFTDWLQRRDLET
ncbi:site-specific recombinase XerD, partial [Halogeometricum pallidum JCM 14848]